jgi:hypothetical protein
MSVIRPVFIVHGGMPTAAAVEDEEMVAVVEMRQHHGINS